MAFPKKAAGPPMAKGDSDADALPVSPGGGALSPAAPPPFAKKAGKPFGKSGSASAPRAMRGGRSFGGR